VLAILADLTPSRVAASIRHVVVVYVQVLHINVVIIVVKDHLAIFAKGSLLRQLRHPLYKGPSRSIVSIQLIVAWDAAQITLTEVVKPASALLLHITIAYSHVLLLEFGELNRPIKVMATHVPLLLYVIFQMLEMHLLFVVSFLRLF
jgi:hypothetical protein